MMVDGLVETMVVHLVVQKEQMTAVKLVVK